MNKTKYNISKKIKNDVQFFILPPPLLKIHLCIKASAPFSKVSKKVQIPMVQEKGTNGMNILWKIIITKLHSTVYHQGRFEYFNYLFCCFFS